jgi:hypothetical protein
MENSRIENRVYITNSNASILRESYFKLRIVINDELKSELYKDDLSWILSDLELKSLFIETLVFDKNPFFTLDADAMVLKKRDVGHLFISDALPKYHFNKECTYIKSGYLNFIIPPEIQSRGSEAIAKFREFAKANKNILIENQKRFLTMLEARFFLKNMPTEVAFSNSGVSDFANLKIEEMEEKIDRHLADAKSFMEANQAVKKLNYAPATIIKQRATLEQHDKDWHFLYKKNLKSMLRPYLRKRANPDLSYSKSFLDSLGFEGCKACEGKIDLA